MVFRMSACAGAGIIAAASKVAIAIRFMVCVTIMSPLAHPASLPRLISSAKGARNNVRGNALQVL